MPFVYVESAGYQPGVTWPQLRAAQAVALKLPRVARATAIDLSDPTSTSGEIHPRRKQEVGRRLSLAMQSLMYTESKIKNSSPWSGPRVNGVQIIAQSTSRSEIHIGFEPGTANALHFAGTAACTSCCDDVPFYVLDDEGHWIQAESAAVNDDEQMIVLSVDAKTRILGFRYAWQSAPQCVLYNGVGGPDDHHGIPMAPMEWCVSYSEGAWTGNGCRKLASLLTTPAESLRGSSS